MKKFLALLGILCFTLTAHAGIITIENLTSDSSVTYDYFNNSFTTVKNEINGNLESVNILDGTIADADLSTAIKFANWYTESFGNWTYEGMLPATDTDLTSDISAGTSYVEGQRITTAATAKTYTASKDTYVYIDKNGAFQYQEVANGASQPSDPADSLILAKVVTDGSQITSVTDLRQTVPPNLRIYADYKSGLYISRDTATATSLTIGRGGIDFGSGVTAGSRRNTSGITIDVTTTGRGGLDTGSLAKGFYYAFAVADDDNTANYEGIASLSATDATGVTGERPVGWFYAPTTSAISPDSCGAYRGQGGDAPNIVSRVGESDITTTSTSFEDMEGMDLEFYTSGRPLEVTFAAPFENSGNNFVFVTVSMDGIEVMSTKYDLTDTLMDNIAMTRAIKPSAGEKSFQVRWRVDAGTGAQNGATEGQRAFTVEEK